MKKLGSTTVILGFIAFFIIMLLIYLDFQIGKSLINYWPILFICLGGELLYESKDTEDLHNIKYNKGIFLIILLFLCAQGYSNINDNVKNNISKNKYSITVDDIFTYSNTLST